MVDYSKWKNIEVSARGREVWLLREDWGSLECRFSEATATSQCAKVISRILQVVRGEIVLSYQT